MIKAVLKALKGIDGSDVVQLRPREQYDETDLNELSFSNWNLVFYSHTEMNACFSHSLMV